MLTIRSNVSVPGLTGRSDGVDCDLDIYNPVDRGVVEVGCCVTLVAYLDPAQ